MTVVVQKFGGTSVGDVDRIRRCARRAVAAHREGHRVVVVVSAMGKKTDELISLAREIAEKPAAHELDMLLVTGEQVSASLMAMAIQHEGVPAIALFAANLGIKTDPVHGNAKIQAIDAEKIRENIDAGRIVVAPGFTGLTEEGDVTTLGRGGSDTTAVAIAAALGVRPGCGLCEIYTDVDGVYSADPRIVPRARMLREIAYEEMVELASLGAGVLHTRAVMFGQRFDVPIHVRNSGHDLPGTMVVKETSDMERVSVVGCALTPELGRISVRGLPNEPGMQRTMFDHIARANVLVDDIIQIESGKLADVCFTVETAALPVVKVAVKDALAEIGRGEMSIEVGLAKISAVGVGMRTHTGVAATMFRALGDAGIPIANITTSEIKISCLVPREDGEKALRVVHDAFDLANDIQVTTMKPDASKRTRESARR